MSADYVCSAISDLTVVADVDVTISVLVTCDIEISAACAALDILVFVCYFTTYCAESCEHC